MADQRSSHTGGSEDLDAELSSLDEPDELGAVVPAPERFARLLLGAGSGGVLGLVAAGVLGATTGGGEISFWVLAAMVVLLAAGMAVLSGRQALAGLPAPPRAVWAGVLSAGSLLLAEAVYLFQAAYIQALTARGERVTLPLAVWPASLVALWIAALLAAAGFLAALLGWADAARERDKYSAGKWVAHSILTGGAALGLGLACYLMGNGLSVGG
jgi:hypothetical protein